MRRSSIKGYIPSRNRTFCEGFSSPASYCFNLFPNVFCSLTVPLNRLPDISDRKKAAFEIVAVSSFGFSRRYRLHTIYQSCSDFVSSLVELCLGPLFCPPGFTARCLLFGDCETCRRAIELGGACFRGLLRTVSGGLALMRGLLRTGEVEPSAWCPYCRMQTHFAVHAGNFPRSAWGALQSGPREQRPFDGLLPSFMSKTGQIGFKTEWFSESIRLTACDDFPAIHPRPLLGATTASAAAPKALGSP